MKRREDAEWIEKAIKNGISKIAYLSRINKLGWDPEKAATEPLKCRRMISKKYYEIAEKNGISRDTVYARVHKYKWPVQRAITEPKIRYSFKIPDGFNKFLKAALKNGITKNVFIYRIKNGWDLEKASTLPIKDMCKRRRQDAYWIEKAIDNGINYRAYLSRCNDLGWSPRKAATVPLQNNKYGEFAEIAEANGINKATFYSRVTKQKWSLEKAANTPVIKLSLLDFDINPFRLTKKDIEIAEKNGICEKTVRGRMNSGWSIQKAINMPIQSAKYAKSDEYKDYYAMAMDNGIKPTTFISRIYRGYAPSDATLTLDKFKEKFSQVDNNEWAKLADQNGIKHKTYYQRIHRLGWTPKEAATTPKLSPDEFLNDEKREKSLAAFKNFKKYNGRRRSKS